MLINICAWNYLINFSHLFQCIFSSGKSIAAIVVAQYVEKNLLNYSEKVSKYWPEFGQNDKENITLADVLRHESGLSWLDHTFAKEDFYSENIKANKIGEIIEKCAQKFPGKTSREYHLISRGCILNEIIRRVDPQNRTIGEIIRQVSKGSVFFFASLGGVGSTVFNGCFYNHVFVQNGHLRFNLWSSGFTINKP